MPYFTSARTFLWRLLTGVMVCALLTACAAQGPDRDPTDDVFDPHEARNREIHAFNLRLDRKLVRPSAKRFTALPDGVENGVTNFATNLAQPSIIANSLLQGDLRGTGIATLRFTLNTTIGLLGLFDAATELGVAPHSTDFGETLHVWGAGEGAYMELPIIGPSTTRDTAGRVVDLVTNPLGYFVGTPEVYYGALASGLARLGYRGRYSDTVDAILYESADSYAQARLIYLQNRRYALGQTGEAGDIDPFELNTEGF